MRRAFFALVYILISTPAAWAQSAPAPTFSLGDRWVFRDANGTRERSVVKVDGESVWFKGEFCETCIMQSERDHLSWLALLDADGKPVDVMKHGFVPISGWRTYDFPLEVGKKWQISATAFVRGTSRPYEIDSRVERYEAVTVAAGTFKAFKIVRDVSLKLTEFGRVIRWTDTVWYAPDAKIGVKYVTTRSGGSDSELVSYSVK